MTNFFLHWLNTNLIENATRREKQSQPNKYRSGIKIITAKKKRAENRENLQGVDEALAALHGGFVVGHGGVERRRGGVLELHCCNN